MPAHELTKISIPISELKELSEIEIGFFSALGVTLNDIMMHWKLIPIFGNRAKNKYEDEFREQQVVSLIIDQIGRLFECKKLIASFLAADTTRAEYYDSLTEEEQDNLKRFNSISKSKFKTIRNKYSNHYELDEMSKIAEENIELLNCYDLFVSDYTNMRFLGPDYLRHMGILKIWGCKDLTDLSAVDNTMQIIISDISKYTSYLQKFTTTIFKRMVLKLDSDKVKVDSIHIEKIEYLGDINIPFFVTNQNT